MSRSGRVRWYAIGAMLAAIPTWAQPGPNPLTGTLQDQLLQDNNSNTQADPGDRLRYTIIINNAGPTDATGVVLRVNLDPNTTFIDGSLTSGILAVNDLYGDVLAHTSLTIPSASGVLGNDVSPAGAPLSVVGYTAASALGGTVQVAADGGFSYLAPPGMTATSDYFTYIAGDNQGHLSVATAELALVGPLVWYVDNGAPAGGNGTRYAPFDSLAPLNNSGSDADGPGDTIFVFEGNAVYSGGLALESGQQLLGQGVDLVVLGQTLVAAGSRPTLTRAGGPCLTLAAGGDTIRGLNLDNSSGEGVSGSALSGAYVLEAMAITRNAGDGVNFANGGAATLAMNDLSIETTASGRGLAVTGIALGLTGHVSRVAAADAAALQISGCAIDATFDSVARGSGAGLGVALQNNSGSTRIGDLALANSGATGLLASNAGSVAVTGATSFIETTGGRALSVDTSSVTALFERVSASGGDYGIWFSSTGGSLTVTGVGQTPDSGGTLDTLSVDAINVAGAAHVLLRNLRVQNCADNGVQLANVSDVTLERCFLQNTASHGMTGTGVTGLALSACQVQNCGDAAGEDALYFAAPGVDNLLGNASILDCVISDFHNDGFSVENISGTLIVDVSGGTFQNSDASPHGGSGLLVSADGTNEATLTVHGGSLFSALRADAVVLRSEGTASRISGVVQDCTIVGGVSKSGGINVGAFGAATVHAGLVAARNALSGLGGPAFVLRADGSARLDAVVGGDSDADGNVINGAGAAVMLRADGDDVGAASAVVAIKRNRIDAITGQTITALARHGSAGLDLTLTANHVGENARVAFSELLADSQDTSLMRLLLDGEVMSCTGVGVKLTADDSAVLHAILRGANVITSPGLDGVVARTATAGSTLCLNLNATVDPGGRNQATGGYHLVRGQSGGPFVGTFLVQNLSPGPTYTDLETEDILEAANDGGVTAEGGDAFLSGTCQPPGTPAP